MKLTASTWLLVGAFASVACQAAVAKGAPAATSSPPASSAAHSKNFQITLCNSYGSEVTVSILQVGHDTTVVQSVPVAAPWPTAAVPAGHYQLASTLPVAKATFDMKANVSFKLQVGKNGKNDSTTLVIAEVTDCS